MPLRTQDRLCYTIASLRTVQKHFASTRMVLLQANEYRDEVCNLLETEPRPRYIGKAMGFGSSRERKGRELVVVARA